MGRKTKIGTSRLLALAVLIVAPVAARAQAELEMISGAYTVTETLGPTLSYNGPVGGWVINITAGPTGLGLDENVVIAANVGVLGPSGPLEILVSSEFPSTAGGYTASVSGSLGGPSTLTDTFSSYYGDSLLTTANPLTAPLSFTSSTFSGSDTGIAPGGTYLTAEDNVTGGVYSSAFTLNFTLSGISSASIPDGGMTLALLGGVVAGMVGIRFTVKGKDKKN
jgi:hypothetical protein